MLQIFAEAIVWDFPWWFDVTMLLIYLAIYLTLISVASFLAAQTLGRLARVCFPGGKVGRRLYQKDGLNSYAKFLAFSSALLFYPLVSSIWPRFDAIESDALGNSLFVVLITLIMLAAGTFLFCIYIVYIHPRFKKRRTNKSYR